MKKRTFQRGCFLIIFLVLILLASGGGWWYFRSRVSKAEFKPESPVLVFLLSPASGEEMKAGDLVPVTLQAAAPIAIQSAELFVDGKSLGAVTDSPESAEWTWQAWPLGIHTLSARATAADGQVGQSQTVIVNVLAGDGKMQVSAEEGQTLEQIGASFGVPADQMAAANPHVDPTQPLAGGQPVDVPVGEGNAGGGGAGSGSEPGGGQGQPPSGGNADLPPFISIIWNIKFTQPVDKSYCYISSGDGHWEKMPKEPFNFFQSLDSLYTQLIPLAKDVVIQVDCWGWLGGALKYLGQGKTSFDSNQPPNEVMINAAGFQFAGMPQIPIQEEKFTGGGQKTIPPPFAVRFAKDAAECVSHAHPLLAPFICNTLMNAPVKEYNILVWEWQAEACWPGYCQYGINQVDGYRIYAVPDFTKKALYSPKSIKYLKTVSDPQKAAAIPLPWAGEWYCYGVEAFVNDAAVPPSAMVKFCPAQEPAPQKITLTPTHWLTAGGTWVDVGDCDTYGGAEYYVAENKETGFGNQPGEVLVGAYIVDDDNHDCFRQGEYYGAVKFDIAQSSLSLPSNAVIQKAELKYSTAFKDYGATGVATNENPSCVSKVGRAKQDWTGLVGGNHYSSKSLGSYFAPYADLASVVKGWRENPSSNYGLILMPAVAPKPQPVGDWDGNVTGTCFDGLANFQLDIYYFVP